MPDEVPAKPIPEPDEASQPFFDGAREGRLMLMRCGACRTLRFPSRMHCDACLSTDVDWVEASGKGTVRTFGIMHQRYHPAWAAELPYNLAVVELAEGPRLVTNLVGVANEDISVGMPVAVDWEVHDDVTLPKFRPV